MTPIRLHPYPAYKDSGIEWLGKIPAHWEVTRLKFFTTVQLSNVDKKSKEGEDKVRLCNYVDVYYNERIDKRIEFMPATATSEQVRRFSLQSGDVLITKDSETWTDIGVPAVVSEDLPGVLCGYHLAHIRPGQHCNSGFLSRLIAAIGPRDQYHISANGITRFGLTGDSVRAGVFALPPLPEQRAIAAFLDRETARIDALVAKKQRLIELLQEKRAALISHAVTQGLDPNVSTKDSGVDWLGKIPAHWEVNQLSHVIRRFVDYRGKTPAKAVSGVPLVTAKNIKNQVIDYSASREYIPEELYSQWMIRGLPDFGDVVITTEAPLGETAVITNTNVALAQRVILLKANMKKISNEYLKYHFVGHFGFSELQTRATGSTAIGIKASHLKASLITIPTIREQIAIANFLDREIAKIDALVAKVREAIDRLKELRQALISAVVTGKIDLSNSL